MKPDSTAPHLVLILLIALAMLSFAGCGTLGPGTKLYADGKPIATFSANMAVASYSRTPDGATTFDVTGHDVSGPAGAHWRGATGIAAIALPFIASGPMAPLGGTLVSGGSLIRSNRAPVPDFRASPERVRLR